MDFAPMKKDRKPDENGLFGWESPRLKAELLRAKKPATEGLTPTTGQGTVASSTMIQKDLPKKVAAEPRAESVVRTPNSCGWIG